MTKTAGLFSRLNQNAQTPEMKKVKEHFFSLFRGADAWMDNVAVVPKHGPNKSEEITISSSDIYSVWAYKDGVACLRVRKTIAKDQGGVTLPGHRDGLIFVSGDLDYMNALFDENANKDALFKYITQDDIDQALNTIDEMRRARVQSVTQPHP